MIIKICLKKLSESTIVVWNIAICSKDSPNSSNFLTNDKTIQKPKKILILLKLSDQTLISSKNTSTYFY